MLGPEIPVLYERVEFGTSARFAFVHAGPTSRNAPFGGFDEVIYRLSTSPRVEFNPRQSPPPPASRVRCALANVDTLLRPVSLEVDDDLASCTPSRQVGHCLVSGFERKGPIHDWLDESRFDERGDLA
jgi:hypothetical protein